MKTSKHPILDLIINEDGTTIIYEGKALKILTYHPERSNYDLKRVNFMGRTHCVGKLVCEAWNGMRDTAAQTLHRKDFNPENDHYTNLYWGIRGQKGTARTKRANSSKVKPVEIPSIIRRIESGETLKNIGQSFNTSEMSIYRIKKRFMQDQMKMLKEKVMHAKNGYQRQQAYANHLGYKTVTEAINSLGNHTFKLKTDSIAVTL